MPTSCSAYNCTNRHTKGTKLSFYIFPLHNPDLYDKWRIAVKRADWKATKNSRICSQHFKDDDFVFGNSTRRLKIGAVPSIFNFSSPKRKDHKKQAFVPRQLPEKVTIYETHEDDNTEGNVDIPDSVQRNLPETTDEVHDEENTAGNIGIPAIVKIKLPKKHTIDEVYEEDNPAGNIDTKTPCSPTLDHIYCLPGPSKVHKTCEELRKKLMETRKQLRVARQKCMRKEKRICDLKQIVNGMRNSVQIEEHWLKTVLDEF